MRVEHLRCGRSKMPVLAAAIAAVLVFLMGIVYFKPLLYDRTFIVDGLQDEDHTDQTGLLLGEQPFQGCFSYGPYISLDKGNYIVKINYESEETNHYFITGGNGSYIICEGELPPSETGISVPVKLYSDVNEDGFEVLIDDNGGGAFTLRSVRIVRSDSRMPAVFMLAAYAGMLALAWRLVPADRTKILYGVCITIYMFLNGCVFSVSLLAAVLCFAAVCAYIYLAGYRQRIKDGDIVLCIFVFAAAVMFFCTESSPFYTIQRWNDSQSYFTMGRGIFHGLAPYKDLFEQKGPLFYIFYGIGSLFVENDLYGVYLLEALFFGAALIFVYRISGLFLTKPAALLVALVFPVFVLNGTNMQAGGSCEQFLMPFHTAGIYYFLRYFRSGAEEDKPAVLFLQGFLGACVVFMKFNTALFWGGFGLMAFLKPLLRADFKKLAQNILAVAAGAWPVTSFLLLYLGETGAAADFLEANFFFNAKYSKLAFGKEAFYLFLGNVLKQTERNFTCFALILFGITVFCIRDKWLDRFGRCGLALSFVLLHYGVFLHTVQPYYFMMITPFVLFGLIAAVSILEDCFRVKVPRNAGYAGCILCLFLAVHYNGNYKESVIYDTSLTAQERFAYEMHRLSDNPTLLNLGFLDGGFYTYAGILPNVRFFQRQNISYEDYPPNRDVQLDALREKKTEFVVFGDFVNDAESYQGELENNYERILTYGKYFLYRAKNVESK